MENASDNATPSPLTKAQVEAVRFQVTKPGYAFPQVEAFIEKTKSTLEFLESEMKKDKIALAEAQDEIELLTERALTLNATLEIFRVKGDAIVNPEGEYVTESQVGKTRKLEEENAYLREQLRIAQEDANSGWEAEAELRKYIEEQLLPWLEKNKNNIVSNINSQQEESIPLVEDDVFNISFDEELERPEHVQITEEKRPTISSDDENDWFK